MKLILLILAIIFTNQLLVNVTQEEQINNIVTNMRESLNKKDLHAFQNQFQVLEHLTGNDVQMNKQECLNALKALEGPLKNLLKDLEHFNLKKGWKDVQRFIQLAEQALAKCE